VKATNIRQQKQTLARERSYTANFPKSSMPLVERIHSFHCAQHTYRNEEKRKKIEREEERDTKKERKKEGGHRKRKVLLVYVSAH
jgi:hypothetical protein